MSKRILIVVVVAVAVLATGIATDTAYSGRGHHHGNIPINWRVSGTIVNVPIWFIPSDPPGSPPDTRLAVLIDAFLKGAPGRARFRVLAALAEGPPAVIPECLGDGQYFDFDDMVIIFNDLSMLFAKKDPDLRSWSCFTGEPAVANMEIIGGTGKYEDAGGYFQGIFGGFTFEDSGALIAEFGTIVGEIER